MKLMFYGVILLNLDLTLNLGNNALNLLPTFVGIILLGMGMKSFRKLSTSFSSTFNIAFLMAVYAGAVWVMDVLGLTATMPQEVSFVIGIISTVIKLFLDLVLVDGVEELEKKMKTDLNFKSLRTFWRMELAVSVATYLGIIMPIISLVFIIIGFFINILYVVAFYETRKRFDRAVLETK